MLFIICYIQLFFSIISKNRFFIIKNNIKTMRKLKYVMLFESYTDTDFEASNDKTQTSGKFMGKLTPKHQELLNDLKDMFIDGSFKGISSGDGGAIIGSGAGKRNVEYITFKFAFYQPTTILRVFANIKENSYTVSIENPNNSSESIEEEFKTKYDLLKFIGGMGRLKKYMK
jgi:hypothetical protein